MRPDRSSLRGRDVRRALHGEQPVQPARHAHVRGVSVGFKHRDVRLLVVAAICGLVAGACLYLVVAR